MLPIHTCYLAQIIRCFVHTIIHLPVYLIFDVIHRLAREIILHILLLGNLVIIIKLVFHDRNQPFCPYITQERSRLSQCTKHFHFLLDFADVRAHLVKHVKERLLDEVVFASCRHLCPFTERHSLGIRDFIELPIYLTRRKRREVVIITGNQHILWEILVCYRIVVHEDDVMFRHNSYNVFSFVAVDVLKHRHLWMVGIHNLCKHIVAPLCHQSWNRMV